MITLEHAEAIVAAADAVRPRVILQISENAVRYHGGAAEPILAAVHALAAPLPRHRWRLHLDHVTDDALVDEAVHGRLRRRQLR